jgi:hypothetical protein
MTVDQIVVATLVWAVLIGVSYILSNWRNILDCYGCGLHVNIGLTTIQ